MPKISFDLAAVWLEFRFGELRDSVDLFERLLEDEAIDFEARVRSQAEELSSEEDRAEFLEYMSHEHAQLHERFPNLTRRALFLTIYAEIESYLIEVCDRARKLRGLRLPLRELRRKGIGGARVYLTKVAGAELASSGREWQALTDYNKVRNLLAHAGGRLSKEGREGHLGEYIREHPHLRLDWDVALVIEQGFCEEVIDTSLGFLKHLPRELLR